ncbi:MAG: hypothetical protein KF852_07535 [Saprospiraceae bacterium]|nr:hypothetical protein [Saprospiraceae bacterium]
MRPIKVFSIVLLPLVIYCIITQVTGHSLKTNQEAQKRSELTKASRSDSLPEQIRKTLPSLKPANGDMAAQASEIAHTVMEGSAFPPRFTLSEAQYLSVECAKLEIPAGALDREIAVTMTSLQTDELPPLDQDLVNVTCNEGGVRCLPHGLQFSNEVTLQLGYDQTLIPSGYAPSDITTFFYDEERKRWMPIPKDSLLENENYIASLTTHFTDFINGIIKVPDAPETQAYTPTSIKDLKAADPSAGIVAIEPPTPNNTGSATLQFPLKLPAGRQGMQPQLALRYNHGGDNGWTGLGWDISLSSVSIETRWGVPRYDAGLETETYLLEGMPLTPVAHRTAPVNRTGPEKRFFPRVEGGFQKITRHGTNPKNYWWEVIGKDGTRMFYGANSSSGFDTSAVLTDDEGNVAHWALREVRDLNDNFVRYHYVKVSDPGVIGGTVPGFQLYIDLITYTGNGQAEGKYAARFFTDRNLGEPRRADVQISGRLGFKQVTADLLRRIEVTYDNQSVRTYDLEYTEGVFSKTLLAAIVEKDREGQEFYRHDFEYHNDVYQDGQLRPYAHSDWEVESENFADNIHNSRANFNGNFSVLGASSSSQGNIGGAVTFGPPILCGSKELSVGVNFSAGNSNSEGVITMLDIDGDNLPDKVFRRNGALFYRPNLSGATGGQMRFGDIRPVLGIDHFSQSNSSTSSFGFEANAFAFFGKSESESDSEIGTYMADFNGDGLIDLAQYNQVYFNRINSAGLPEFDPQSDETPNPIAAGTQLDPTLITIDPMERERLTDKYPLHDVVRMWRAPYPGVISIRDTVRRIQPQNTAGQNYAKKDDLRVALQVRGGELDSFIIGPNDYSERYISSNVTVDSGDQVYFRLQSVFDGAYDEIYSNPTITYTDIIAADLESSGLRAGRFSAAEDFITASPQMLTLPFKGQVRVTGNFGKPVTSDSLTLEIIRTRNEMDSIVFVRGFAWDEDLVFAIDDTISVDSADDLSFKIKSSTNIGWAGIDFVPVVQYIQAENSEGQLNVFDANGDPQFTFCPAVRYSIFNEVYARTVAYRASGDGQLTISPSLNVNFPLGGNPPNIVRGTVTFSVKGVNRLYARETFDFTNTVFQSNVFPISIDVSSGDQLFFEYHFEDRYLTDSIILGANVTGVPSDMPFLIGQFTFLDEEKAVFGPLYRGWGQFIYNGNRLWGQTPIQESELKLSTALRTPPSRDQIRNTDSPDGLETLYNPAYDRFIVMVADAKNRTWRGYDDRTWLKADTMSSSRLGRDDISLDFSLPIGGTGLLVPNKVSRSVSSNTAFGGSVPGIPIPVGLSGSYSSSNSTTENLIEIMDMNGDRYPDVIGKDKIQYSTILGGRENTAIPHFQQGNHVATAEAGAWTLGGSFTQAKTNNTGGPGGGASRPSIFQPAKLAASMFKCEKAPETAGQSLGVSGNVSFGNNEDATQHTWLDINGDGLPDKVMENGTAALNLGYKFAAPEPWHHPTIRKGESEDFSAGGGLGFNIGNLSISGGFGLSRTDNNVNETLQDINGDGLADIVTLGSPLRVRINTGSGFSDEILLWSGAAEISSGSSTGSSQNFGVTFCFHLLPVITVVKICVNFNGSGGSGVSREHFQMADINGDGYPDLLRSDQDGHLDVSTSTIGRTNFLRKVHRPLGGAIDLDYTLKGNTYAMPQGQWVLASTEIFDGLDGDGVSIMKTVFDYEDGFYHRREREFFGFKTVRATQLNTADGNAPYRTTVSTYGNDNYFTKNILLFETTLDAAGNNYLETVNTYEIRDISTGVPHPNPSLDDAGAAFPALISTRQLFYEGQPAAGIQTTTLYDYDLLGNVIFYAHTGDNSPGDLLSAEITYHDIPQRYVKSIPQSIRVLVEQGEIRKREADIDDEGNVIQIRQFLEDGQAAVYEMEYFDNGNLKKITRPPNYRNERLWFEYEYDDQVQTYVTRVSNAHGYASSSVYEYAFGQMLETTDINNQKTTYSIDAKGRISTITGPYELAAGKPYTIAYEYHPQASVAYAKTKHYDPEHDSDIVTITFMDGLMRPVQVKKTGALYNGAADQDVMIVSGRVHFDAFGRTISTWYPVTDPTGSDAFYPDEDTEAAPTLTTFDVLDRPIVTTLPDGATAQTAYSIGEDIAGNITFITTETDPLGNVRASYTDVRERRRATRAVGPQGDIWTTFQYNAISELLTVTDHEGNRTEYTYDQLGRQLSITHPASGTNFLTYDIVGNKLSLSTPVIRLEIADTAAIRYQYDFERLVQVDYPKNFQNRVVYHYGVPGATHNRAGRIWLQEDASGGHEYFYGPLGEVVKDIRTIVIDPGKIDTYVWEAEYDTWNRVQTMYYPDGEKVDYIYNRAGKLKRLTGKKGPHEYVYVDQVGYDKFEQRAFFKHGNGAETTYKYDPARRWLSHMEVKALLGRKIIDNTYAFDAVGNILSITNSAVTQALKPGGPVTHTFEYDELYRLTEASGHWAGYSSEQTYVLLMEYDNLHNVRHKTQTHHKQGNIVAATTHDMAYTYDASRPFTPTKIGRRLYEYDVNGNMSGWTVENFSYLWRKVLWDEENRIRAISDNGFVSQYTYDAFGERAIKSSGGSQGVFVDGAPAGFIAHQQNYTAYVSPYLVAKDGRFTKHYFIEGQRVASKTGNGYFQNRNHFNQNRHLTAGSLDYNLRAHLLRQAFAENATAVIPDSLYRTPPPAWRFYPGPPDPNGPPGPPVWEPAAVTNDNVRAGYAFRYDIAIHPESNRYFFHPDHLGSTSYVTDAVAEIRQHVEYMPFGEIFVDEYVTNGKQPYLFNAKELDAETGLYYYGARYYDPLTNMWASVDPMAEKYPGLSPYNYTLLNPVRLVDPDGRLPILAIGAAFLIPAGIEAYSQLVGMGASGFDDIGSHDFSKSVNKIALSGAIGSVTSGIGAVASKFLIAPVAKTVGLAVDATANMAEQYIDKGQVDPWEVVIGTAAGFLGGELGDKVGEKGLKQALFFRQKVKEEAGAIGKVVGGFIDKAATGIKDVLLGQEKPIPDALQQKPDIE